MPAQQGGGAPLGSDAKRERRRRTSEEGQHRLLSEKGGEQKDSARAEATAIASFIGMALRGSQSTFAFINLCNLHDNPFLVIGTDTIITRLQRRKLSSDVFK